MGRRAGRGRRVALDAVLWVLAGAGAACILLTVAALALGVSLIMFSTGSMAPVMPTGTLAAVQRIPASEVRVGDVVTVDRAGLPPITHRVVAVSGRGEPRTIVMKGDANRRPDPEPYVVDSVRIVRWSAPGLAYPVSWLQSPYVLGTATLVMTTLVVTVFWPRRRRGVAEEPVAERSPAEERADAR